MIWKFIWLIVFSSLAAYVFQILLFLDYGKRVYNHKPGPCRQLNGITLGSEDVALIEPEGLVFISSGAASLENDRPNNEGNIFLFDFQNPSEDPIKLVIDGMVNRTTFRPHGISHWVTGDRIRLYVISHTPKEFKHLVEVLDFDREKKILKYVKTIRDQKFVRPNAIFAVGEDKFLISNDAEAQTSFANMLEVLMFKKSGSIVFFDGKDSHWVAQGLMSPNGISTDREMKHLFIAHINDKSLGIYDLAEDFKSIKEINNIPLGTAIDNLFVDVDGYLWIGAHPVVKDLVSYWSNYENPDFYAPSQVLRLKFSKEWKIEEAIEVFVDDGRMLCASSGAVHFNGKILIGTPFRQAVVCDIFEAIGTKRNFHAALRFKSENEDYLTFLSHMLKKNLREQEAIKDGVNDRLVVGEHRPALERTLLLAKRKFSEIAECADREAAVMDLLRKEKNNKTDMLIAMSDELFDDYEKEVDAVWTTENVRNLIKKHTDCFAEFSNGITQEFDKMADLYVLFEDLNKVALSKIMKDYEEELKKYTGEGEDTDPEEIAKKDIRNMKRNE